MPRKEFESFTRLDASDVNTFLMDQSVQTFADSTARGSAIATPVEGMVTYLNDIDSLSVYNGTAFTTDRTIQVFAGTAARGSAIGTAVEGMYTHINDTDSLEYYNGSAWVDAISSPTWTSFTPTWTNLTVGNGTYSSAAYLLDGKLAHVSVALVFGSTTSISGDVSITVPEAIARKTALVFTNNAVSITQTGVSNIVGGLISNPTDDRNFFVRVELSNGTYGTVSALSSTIPFTWATGHRIQLAMSYEVL